MKPTKTDSEGSSELEFFQENESLLKQLIGRVAKDFKDHDVDLEVLEQNKISDALTEFIELIARKKRHFSSYKRLIIDFELKNQGNGFHLFVVSLPMKHKFKSSL